MLPLPPTTEIQRWSCSINRMTSLVGCDSSTRHKSNRSVWTDSGAQATLSNLEQGQTWRL